MPFYPPGFQADKGGYGKQNGQLDDITQGMVEMALRPYNAVGSHRLGADESAKHASGNSAGIRAPNGAEIEQKRPAAPKQDPSKPPARLGKPFEYRPSPFYDAGAQRNGNQAPVAKQQYPMPDLSPLRQNTFTTAGHAPVKAAEMIRTGSETYKIISTIQVSKPQDGGMSLGVYVVYTKETKRFVAKRLSTASESQRARAKAEMQALQQIKKALRTPHENLNMLREAFMPENARTGILILEYCNGGSLADGIDEMKARRVTLGIDLAFHFMYGIAKGLAMIHHGILDHTKTASKVEGWKSICHLDIKPANILLDLHQTADKTWSRYPRVVLADFGCSVTSDDVYHNRESKVVQDYGTPGWFPPSIPTSIPSDTKGQYGKPTDIWQTGGVIQVMCLLIFQPDMSKQQLPLPKKYGPELNCLVSTCMSPDFQRRPTAMDLCSALREMMVKKGILV